MNYKKALKILEIKEENFDYKVLKSKYYIKALKYHPDKNNSEDATDKFKEIGEAYNYLKNYKKSGNFENFENNKNNEDDLKYYTSSNNYIYFLYKFILSLNNDIILDTNDINYITNIIFNTENTNYLLKLLKLLPKDKLKIIYNYFINISVLKNSKIVIEIENFLENNLKEDKKYIIYPSIDNLLNHEIYKTKINEDYFYVPLWHNEIVYEISNNRIIFECIPDLTSNINIDDDNNILLDYNIELQKLLNMEQIEICIGSNKYNINIDDIKIKKKQIIVLKNMGISNINYENIYNIDKKSNIYVNLSLH